MNYLCNRTNKLLDCIEMPTNAHTIDLNSDTLLSHILQHSDQKILLFQIKLEITLLFQNIDSRNYK